MARETYTLSAFYLFIIGCTIILLFFMIIIAPKINMEQERQLKIQQEKGLEKNYPIFGREESCWTYCGYGKYFYSPGGLFKEEICLCKRDD